jgi:hypothetical protein
MNSRLYIILIHSLFSINCNYIPVQCRFNFHIYVNSITAVLIIEGHKFISVVHYLPPPPHLVITLMK